MTEIDWSDTRERYEHWIVKYASGPHPPVEVVEIHDIPHLKCAKGHEWGAGPLSEEHYGTIECPVCRDEAKYRAMGRPDCIRDGCVNVVNCSERAWAAGVRTCRMHHEEDLTQIVTNGPVCLDEFVTVLGQYSANRWNGWLMPSIDPWAAQHVLEVIFGDGDEEQQELYSWEWDDEKDVGYILVQDAEAPGEYDYRLYPDEDGLYGLGAGSWTWSEDSFTCQALVDNFPCLRFPNHEGEHIPMANDPDDLAREYARGSVRIAAANENNRQLIEKNINDRIALNHEAGERALAEYDRVHGTPPWSKSNH